MSEVFGHVLIPNRANYSSRPRWFRRWETPATKSNLGGEVRKGLHSAGRVSLEYRVTSKLAEMAKLDALVRAAATSGLACCPLFGRGAATSGDLLIGGNEVDVVDACWEWRAADWFFVGGESGFDALLVTSAELVGNLWHLEFDGVATDDWAGGSMAWPLLFGQFELREQPAVAQSVARFELRVSELKPRVAQIGETPVVGPGIGEMEVGTDFEVS
jgi:hypothetical protein